MKTCKVIELGRIGYSDALDLQHRLVAARKSGACPDVLLLCEHPHVITMGRNGSAEHLRLSPERLGRMGVEFHPTDRGGDVTYHGPGQVVGYPIVQLGEIRRDVGWYVRQLEQTMIEAGREFGVATFRVSGRTGVWAQAGGAAEMPAALEQAPPAEKLGAIGVHLSRWVTSHGFAYNVSTDLSYFDLIVPCGLSDCCATSLEKLLGRAVPMAEARQRLAEAFGRALGLEMEPAEDLSEVLHDRTRTEPATEAAAPAPAPLPAPVLE